MPPALPGCARAGRNSPPPPDRAIQNPAPSSRCDPNSTEHNRSPVPRIFAPSRASLRHGRCAPGDQARGGHRIGSVPAAPARPYSALGDQRQGQRMAMPLRCVAGRWRGLAVRPLAAMPGHGHRRRRVGGNSRWPGGGRRQLTSNRRRVRAGGRALARAAGEPFRWRHRHGCRRCCSVAQGERRACPGARPIRRRGLGALAIAKRSAKFVH